MFDFWKEVVINAAEIDGLPRVSVEGDVLRVLRCADYAKDGIVNGVIYKTMPQDEVKAKITVAAEAPAAGNVLRLMLDLRLVGKADSDFAQPWSVFKKPVIVESASVEGLLKNLKAIVPADYAYIKINGAEVECANGHMVIREAKIDEIDVNGAVVKSTALIASEGKPAVGTGEWILENLRFPTNQNLRYAALNADEMPIRGAKYVQFAFEYAVPNRGLHGQGTVGQEMTSVTHHVFYVREDLTDVIAAFESLSGIVTPVVAGESEILAEDEETPAVVVNPTEE